MSFVLQYQKVFDLFIWHDFFLAPGTGDTFNPPPLVSDYERLRPYSSDLFVKWSLSPESLQAVQNKGLIFKPNRYGCFIVSKNAFNETDTNARVTLLGKLTDPKFFTYTDLGFTAPNDRRQGRIFYLTNSGLTLTPRINLSRSGGNFTTIVNNLYLWQTRIVRLPKVIGSGNTTIQVFDKPHTGGALVLSQALISPTDAVEYEVDCRALPSGLYRFESPHLTTNPSTLYIGQEQTGSAVLFVIDIFLAGLSNGKFDIRFNHI